MRYPIESVQAEQKKFDLALGKIAEDYFRSVNPRSLQKNIRQTRIVKPSDIGGILTIPAMYIILTDYRYDSNPCRFITSKGLKAIYRGQGAELKKRIQSHLFNKLHQQEYGEGCYRVCMKLDGNNGISIDQKPYSDHTWVVAQISMRNTIEQSRVQAEFAFDRVFGRPLASRELPENNSI